LLLAVAEEVKAATMLAQVAERMEGMDQKIIQLLIQ
jgi:hypothetical protein